jgi:hypothetical protein
MRGAEAIVNKTPSHSITQMLKLFFNIR